MHSSYSPRVQNIVIEFCLKNRYLFVAKLQSVGFVVLEVEANL